MDSVPIQEILKILGSNALVIALLFLMSKFIVDLTNFITQLHESNSDRFDNQAKLHKDEISKIVDGFTLELRQFDASLRLITRELQEQTYFLSQQGYRPAPPASTEIKQIEDDHHGQPSSQPV